MKKLALVLVFAASAQAATGPANYVAVAFQSVPVALSAYSVNPSLALISTGLQDYPAVIVSRYQSQQYVSFVGTRNPAHLRAFPTDSNPVVVARFVSSLTARARGVVMVAGGAIVVWWIE